MAKINKYWGMVALGAVTAAAAGAVAAAFAKRRALDEATDLEDDFEDDPKTNEQPEPKEAHEDFISWEATSDEEAEALTEDEDTEETEALAEDEDTEETEALTENENTELEATNEEGSAQEDCEAEEASIHID